MTCYWIFYPHSNMGMGFSHFLATSNCNNGSCNMYCFLRSHQYHIKISVRDEVIFTPANKIEIYHTVSCYIWKSPDTWCCMTLFLWFKLNTGFGNCCWISSWWRHNICNKRRCITHWGAISWILHFSCIWFFKWILSNSFPPNKEKGNDISCMQ